MSQDINDANGESQVDELIHQQEFGKTLREAREAAALSVSEVSDELKLSEEIIRALEYSQVDALPAPTFTQGYIRSYARLLKLSGDEIVEAYTQFIPKEEPTLTATSGVPAQSTSKDTSIKLVTYGLIVASFILLVVWWYQSDFSWVAGEKDMPETGEPETQLVIPEKIEEVPAEESPSEDETMALIPEKAPVQPTVSDKDDLQPVQVEPEKQKATAQSVAEKSEAEESEPVSVITGDDVLMMKTHSESWTEVQDANNQRLFFQLMKKGTRYRLQWQAPFRIFMGNAPSVSLQVNNQSVDIGEYIRKNNIAHVSIDEAAFVKAFRGARAVQNKEPEAAESVSPGGVRE